MIAGALDQCRRSMLPSITSSRGPLTYPMADVISVHNSCRFQKSVEPERASALNPNLLHATQSFVYIERVRRAVCTQQAG
jgi:hypothetical protein